MANKDGLTDYVLINYFFYQFDNNFLVLLLYKINVFNIFDVGDFFQIFVISRSTEILIKSTLWLVMYVLYILNPLDPNAPNLAHCFFSFF